jgi:hypothetical protein
MTNNRAVSLLSQMYLPHFDDEEKEALTMAINAIQTTERLRENLKYYLDANEENGIVHIPKFVVEKRIKELKLQ